MNILFLTHYFPPEVNAPASRTHEHCRRWVEAGHQVTVITCVPNHPAGRIYPGYKNRLFQRESMDGIEVCRVLTAVAANSGFLRRTLNYAFFMLMATLVAPFQRRPDIVISTSPQFFCGLSGFFVSRLRRAPWVLEIRDLWPESIVAVGAMKKSRTIRFLEYLESFAYRRADHIISVTDSFVGHIVNRGGRREKISVIKNGVDLESFQPGDVDYGLVNELGLQGKFVAAYVGTHGMAHGLETVLRAAELLRDQENIAFLMVGDGAAKARLVELKAQMGLSNVIMLDQQPRERMPAIWSITSASIVLLRDQAVFRTVIPSKIFESMAMKCPIVLGVLGESREIIDEAGAGLCITPEDPRQLAEATEQLARDAELAKQLGEAGRAFVQSFFNRDELARRYSAVLENLAREGGGSAARSVSPDSERRQSKL